MHYVIWVGEGMWAAEVPAPEVAYLEAEVLPALVPLSAEAYLEGPAAILHTDAPFSYVVRGSGVLWLVAWPPGLLVLHFGADGSMAWTNRASLPEDGEDDDDLRDPHVHLVGDPWSAQLDDQEREWAGFQPASAGVQARWEAAMGEVHRLGASLAQEIGNDEAKLDAWHARCQRSPIFEGQAAPEPR